MSAEEAGVEFLDGFLQDLREGDDHDDAEDEDPEGLEAPAPDGEAPLEAFEAPLHEAVRGPDDRRAEQVERGVDEGCDEGEGAAPHRRDPLREQEDNVGDDVDVDGLFLTIFVSTSSDQE